MTQLLLFYFPQVPSFVVFLIFVLFSMVLGRYTPGIIILLTRRFSPQIVTEFYENLISPCRGLIQLAATLMLISLSTVWIREDYANFYEFAQPFIDFSVIISTAWLASQLLRKFIKFYGEQLLEKLGQGADEALFIFETLGNVLIGFVAVFAFAQSLKFNLIGLMASLGVSGLAIAFAANKILEQIISTIVLYLDRPFIPGDYIRLPDGQVGRVESIGLRSTKIRTVSKSTLLIVPNSNLITIPIENVTRVHKVRVILDLGFDYLLTEEKIEQFKQLMGDYTNGVFGIDPGTTQISTGEEANPNQTMISNAKVSFYVIGSEENAIGLKERLLELFHESLVKDLLKNGIEPKLREITLLIESSMTL